MRLEDFDNDGWKDLFVAQGHVMDNVEQMDASLHYLEAPLLAMNREGRFARSNSFDMFTLHIRLRGIGSISIIGMITAALSQTRRYCRDQIVA